MFHAGCTTKRFVEEVKSKYTDLETYVMRTMSGEMDAQKLKVGSGTETSHQRYSKRQELTLVPVTIAVRECTTRHIYLNVHFQAGWITAHLRL